MYLNKGKKEKEKLLKNHIIIRISKKILFKSVSYSSINIRILPLALNFYTKRSIGRKELQRSLITHCSNRERKFPLTVTKSQEISLLNFILKPSFKYYQLILSSLCNVILVISF